MSISKMLNTIQTADHFRQIGLLGKGGVNSKLKTWSYFGNPNSAAPILINHDGYALFETATCHTTFLV